MIKFYDLQQINAVHAEEMVFAINKWVNEDNSL